MDEPTDERDILERLQNGGTAALADYFEAQRSRLRRMIDLRIDRRLAGRLDASDVLQESFVDIAKRFDEYAAQPQVPLFVWVRFLVRQRLAAVQRWHFQRQKRDPRREVEPETVATRNYDTSQVAHEFSAGLTSPSEVIQRAEIVAKMQSLLDDMDPDDRDVLVLRHFEELTNSEVAAELGISVGAASKRYIRALAKLKQVMGPA